MNTFQNISVLDTTSTNNLVTNNAVVNNAFLTTSLNTPLLQTNLMTNYTGNALTISSANLITLNAPYVTITGSTTYANVTNLDVKDSIIRINKSGLTVGNCGLEVESAGSVVGSFTALGTSSIDNWQLTQGLNITGNLTSSNVTTTGNIVCGNLLANGVLSSFAPSLNISSKNIRLNKGGSNGNVGLEAESGNVLVGSFYANITGGALQYWNTQEPLRCGNIFSTVNAITKLSRAGDSDLLSRVEIRNDALTGNLGSTNIDFYNMNTVNIVSGTIECLSGSIANPRDGQISLKSDKVVLGDLGASSVYSSAVTNTLIGSLILQNNQFYMGDGSKDCQLNIQTSTTEKTVYIRSGFDDITGSSANIFIGNYNQGTTASTRKIMFKNDGNVGIGTATPIYPLQVSGDTYIGGNLNIQTNAFNGLKISSGYRENIPSAGNITYECGGTNNYHYFWDNLEASGNITTQQGFRFDPAISNLSSPFKIITIKNHSVGTVNAGSTVSSTVSLGYTFLNTTSMNAQATISGGNFGELCTCMCIVDTTSQVTLWLRNTGGTNATSVTVNIMILGFQ